ncbi:hypothetical protein EMCRGX_G029885 [Ephydatia muelleri]
MFVTKIHNLSKEDQAESLTIEDLKVGAGLLCDVKGKMYPVEVLEFKELGESLLFSSLKSNKPALCQEKVERIIERMKKQFPTESFDLQVFTHKANQNCRDASCRYAPASTK